MARLMLLGSDTAAVQRIVPLLLRADLELCRLVRADEAVPLLLGTPFALVLARYPLAGLELRALVDAMRSEGCASRRAGLLLLADPAAVEEVGSFLGRGVNRIVTIDSPSERLLNAVADLLGAPPRRAVRAPVQLELWVRKEGLHLLATTENISAAGMLVRGAQEFTVGAPVQFEITFADGAVVRGGGEVVRHADAGREACDGIAIRFDSLEPEGEESLRAFLTANA